MLGKIENIDERLRIALKMHDMGFKVFPLKYPSMKKPPIDGWQDFLICEDDIYHWHAKGHNFGLVCDQVSVVDLDTAEKARWWYLNRPRTPWMTRTPRGGGHFYYGKTDRGNQQHPHYDIRAGGKGYVVLPGGETENGKYELIGNVTLDVPPFNNAWYLSEKKRNQSSKDISNARQFIRGIVSQSGNKKQGAHNATYRVACVLHQEGFSELETLREMLDWQQTNCVDANGNSELWTVDELIHKIRDVFQREHRK